MKKVAILLSLFILASSVFAQSFYQVNITGVNPTVWQNTGIDITAGQYNLMIAKGAYTVITASIGNPGTWNGPLGNGGGASSQYPAPGLSVFALIGKIGTNGTPFVIGDQFYGTVGTTGRLYVTINDFDSNNSGTLALFVYRNIPTTSVEPEQNWLPSTSALQSNYPNPFNPSTTIKYATTQRGSASLAVYNVLGERVKLLLSQTVEPGEYEVVWDGSNETGTRCPSGTYFYQLTLNGKSEARQMLLLK